MKDFTFANLVGVILTEIVIDHKQNEIRFTASDGRGFLMYHERDCCESVVIKGVIGSTNDIIGLPVLSAIENVESGNKTKYGDSVTRTEFKLATARGELVIKWLGTSNGYYSESVSFYSVGKAKDE